MAAQPPAQQAQAQAQAPAPAPAAPSNPTNWECHNCVNGPIKYASQTKCATCGHSMCDKCNKDNDIPPPLGSSAGTAVRSSTGTGTSSTITSGGMGNGVSIGALHAYGPRHNNSSSSVSISTTPPLFPSSSPYHHVHSTTQARGRAHLTGNGSGSGSGNGSGNGNYHSGNHARPTKTRTRMQASSLSRPSMAGWWRCHRCRSMNNPELAPQRCSICGHGKCTGCSAV